MYSIQYYVVKCVSDLRWFSPGTQVSPTNKTDRHDITEILLKVALNTINQPLRLFRIMSIPTTFRLFLVLTSEQIGRRLPVYTLLLWQRQHIIVVDAVDCNCNMETPKKRLSKYWCSIPHYLFDIRNIYIMADRFPLMMLTSANN
jgi:hypothetical protein